MGSIWNTTRIEIGRYSLKLKKNRRGRGVKLAHLSDWHGKRFPQGSGYIHSLLAREKPDVVLITGDLLHGRQKLSVVADELKPIGRTFPCYYVHGNNEHYHRRTREVERFLGRAGITLLTNRARRCRGVCFVGIDDIIEGRPDTVTAFKKTKKHETLVVISLSPGLYRRLLEEGRQFDLFLCGHTHGGQLCLPGGSPLSIDSPGVPLRLGRGWHKIGPGWMLVNRGLGEHFINLRLFCPPELAIITLL